MFNEQARLTIAAMDIDLQVAVHVSTNVKHPWSAADFAVLNHFPALIGGESDFAELEAPGALQGHVVHRVNSRKRERESVASHGRDARMLRRNTAARKLGAGGICAMLVCSWLACS